MARQPENKAADKSSANSISSNDSALIRELALLLDETSLTEIEIERAGLRLRVARNITMTASMPANYQAAAPIGTGAPVTSDANTLAPSALHVIPREARAVKTNRPGKRGMNRG